MSHFNGGCREIGVPEKNARRCECDIGVQLQADQSCASGRYSYYISYWIDLDVCLTLTI